MKIARRMRHTLVLAALTVGVIPAAASASIPYGFDANVVSCTASPLGAPIVVNAWTPTPVGYLAPGKVSIVRNAGLINPRSVAIISHLGNDRFVQRADLCAAHPVASAQVVAAAPAGSRLPALRVNGAVSSTLLQRAANRVTHLNAKVLDRLELLGFEGVLFQGGAVSAQPGFEYLGTSAATGYGRGPGKSHGVGVNLDTERTTNSATLHEIGHAYDMANNTTLSGMAFITPYLELQGGCFDAIGGAAVNELKLAFPTEWYAESFARYFMSQADQDALAAACPTTFAYQQSKLGAAAF